VLGIGKEVLSVHNTRRVNVVGFDHKTGIKRNLPILRESGIMIDSISHRHGGTQQIL
jgi:hypothetical protein